MSQKLSKNVSQQRRRIHYFIIWGQHYGGRGTRYNLIKWSIKGGFLSEKSGGFSLLLLQTLPKNIPFYYPKLLHLVHVTDKRKM